MSKEQQEVTQVVSKKADLAKIIDKENLIVEMGGNVSLFYWFSLPQNCLKVLQRFVLKLKALKY